MASGLFNKGKEFAWDWYFQGTVGADPGTDFYVTLLTGSEPAGTEDTLTSLSEHTRTDAFARVQVLRSGVTGSGTTTRTETLPQVQFTALTNGINNATFAVLCNTDTDNSTVVCFWDLNGAKSVSSGQTLTLQNLKLTLT